MSLSETTTRGDVARLFDLFPGTRPRPGWSRPWIPRPQAHHAIPQDLLRTDAVLTREVFSKYHSETEMLRYIHRLERRSGLNYAHDLARLLHHEAQRHRRDDPGDLARVWQSCTPSRRSNGPGVTSCCWRIWEDWLVKVTEFAMPVCMRPNSGARNTRSLLAIKKYHGSPRRGASRRLPHPGLRPRHQPASAQMAGLKVIVTAACDKAGNVDLDDLRAKAAGWGTSSPA